MDDAWRRLDRQLQRLYLDTTLWWMTPRPQFGRLSPMELWELGCRETVRAAVDDAEIRAAVRFRLEKSLGGSLPDQLY